LNFYAIINRLSQNDYFIRMKFIAELSENEKVTLTEAYDPHPSQRVRQRAHAILLSHQQYGLAQLCHLLGVRHYRTISQWLDAWLAFGITGLFDKPRSGRPPRFNEQEANQLIDYVKQDPKRLKEAATRLQEETNKEACYDTFKRLLKKKPIRGNVAAAP